MATQILRYPAVESRTGLSRATIYRRVKKDPTFPKPVSLGGRIAVGFVESEVEAWLTRQVESRPQVA